MECSTDAWAGGVDPITLGGGGGCWRHGCQRLYCVFSLIHVEVHDLEQCRAIAVTIRVDGEEEPLGEQSKGG